MKKNCLEAAPAENKIKHLEKNQEHDPNCPETPDHSYIILIAGGSASGKTNALLT